MGLIRLMHAKLHHARVTQRRRDYVGSIAVDLDLLEAVGMLPLEEVEVVNIDNGQRWSTYLLPAARGSREVCPNGGGALLCEPGHRLILFCYELIARRELSAAPHRAQVVIVGEDNRVRSHFEQALEVRDEGMVYRTRAVVGALPDQPDLQLSHEPACVARIE